MRLHRRFKKFWRNSQTKMWAYFQLGTSATLEGMHHINHMLNDPTFSGYLDKLDLPKEVIYGMALFGIFTFIFHGHDD